MKAYDVVVLNVDASDRRVLGGMMSRSAESRSQTDSSRRAMPRSDTSESSEKSDWWEEGKRWKQRERCEGAMCQRSNPTGGDPSVGGVCRGVGGEAYLGIRSVVLLPVIFVGCSSSGSSIGSSLLSKDLLVGDFFQANHVCEVM